LEIVPIIYILASKYKMLTYIIIDDNEMYCDYTQEQLSMITNLECLCICKDPIDAREKIIELRPDFVILDIEMPNLSGIDLVKSIKVMPLVIFVTSHPSFATDAFDVDAVDYILKPATNERMFRAIDKIKMLTKIKTENQNIENFSIKEDGSFFIKDKKVYTKILYQDVLYFESLGDFTYIYLVDGQKKVVLSSIKNIEIQLAKNIFIRISRSHIINKNQVTALDSEMVFLNKIQLTIGKTYSALATEAILGKQVIKRFI
jgi:two-component system, LytTR family, response regulator